MKPATFKPHCLPVFLLLSFLLLVQGLSAQNADSLTNSKTAKGRMYLHLGVGLLPTGANLSFHYFITNRVSMGLDLNMAMITATEVSKYTMYRNGQPVYQGTQTDFRQAVGYQAGIRFNLHFKKNPRKFDPYFSFGLDYVKAGYSFLNMESGFAYGKTVYLERTDNYFLPLSAALGYRLHMKNLSTFVEAGFGSYLLRVGFAFRLH